MGCTLGCERMSRIQNCRTGETLLEAAPMREHVSRIAKAPVPDWHESAEDAVPERSSKKPFR